MSETMRLSNRNALIQEMLSDAERIKDFYRFTAQNEHYDLHDACQIVIARPNASVCYSFEEWNAMGRRVTKGRKGIAYADRDGIKRFTFDATDTHGEERYKRLIYPMKRLLVGLDKLNGSEWAGDTLSDYRKIQVGVAQYLQNKSYFTDDEERNTLVCEGVAYSLYCKTGFPKNNGIKLHGMPYSLQDNADLFRDISILRDTVKEEVEKAYLQTLEEVKIIEDIDEETVSDEPIISKPIDENIEVDSHKDKQVERVEKSELSEFYQKYLDAQSEYPDAIVITRFGDFYEVMGEKAKVVADELGLTITGRNVGLSERVMMVGFPYHVADTYIENILREHSVVVLEPDEKPKYIISHKELYAAESYSEQKQTGNDSAGESEQNEETNEEEYFDLDDLEEVAEEPEAKPKAKGKPLSERKRKSKQTKQQFSLFDLMDEEKPEQDYQTLVDKMIERQLKRGSGVEQGKMRIYDTYLKNPTENEYVDFLKQEYGVGGFSAGEDSQMHDGRGIRMTWKNAETNEIVAQTDLKWNQVALKIADLIDDDNYLSASEKEEYKSYSAQRYGTDESRITAIVNEMIKRGTRYTWDGTYNYWGFSDLYKFVKEHSDEIKSELETREEVSEVNASGADITVRFNLIYCSHFIEESSSADDKGTAEERIKSVADYMVETGTENTSQGNYRFEFSECGDDETFVKDHKQEITELLCKREEVSDVEMDNEGIDVNFYLQYCRNLGIVSDLDSEEDKDWEHLIDDGALKPFERQNTDLNAVGFNQSELGGAKARFRSNIEAIRTMKMLYREGRSATSEERAILAKYVGWGGIAKAFDEKDESWQNEYRELKGLLTEEEYNSAKGSVLNAHYTSKDVIDGMYAALKRFGVKGNNRILEPALGTGNFFGFMPEEIRENAKLFGVELDTLTGKIASKLYPDANIQIKGYEQTSFTNDSFDLVVTNVPFGAYSVYDNEYSKHNFYIHDYFIAKSIDKLKPNGLMAVITSKGTMDKLSPTVRKYFAERAELVGAIRLPNNAFKTTANTEVVADILFFRKREELFNADVSNTEWLSTSKTEEGCEINNYFIEHPEMILGTLVEEHGLYGAVDVTVKPGGRPLSEAISEAISRLPQDFYVNPEYSEITESKEIEVDYDVKPLCFKEINGKIYQRVGDCMEEYELPKRPQDAYQRVKAMIDIRRNLREILDMQIAGCSDGQLQAAQWQLNAKYDRFVKSYGILNSQTNIKLFRDDGDSALLFACENVSEDKKTATKADVFSKRTIKAYIVPTQTDDCIDALRISMNERGKVDIEYIEELTRKEYDTVLSELGESIYRNPMETDLKDKYSGFEIAELYLSGNVKQKLRTARRFAQEFPDAGFERNVEALEKVQPTPLTASEISVRIGASWVDKNYYKQFLMHILSIPYYYDDGISIYFNPHDSSWRVDKSQGIRNISEMKVHEVYGTRRASAYRLFEDCLNLRDTKIYDTVEEDGREKRVLNQSETIAAREKQNKMREEFKDWIFSEPNRRDELVARYNDLFNQIRLPSYDGSYLKIPEMNPNIELRPHQKNAIARTTMTGENTLLHHVVGAGKTYTMGGIMAQLRRHGTARKCMFVVPNHIVQQWANDLRTLLPNAKLLIATKEDLEKENRKKFVAKVALGDWDGVIIAQSSFAKIPISSERQMRKLREEISKIEETIVAQWEENSHPRGAVKNLERIKKNREAQLKKLMDDSKKDDVLTFESLGVDFLFIDEAHNYKNLFLFTKMNNVAGISMAASQRATDLKLKCEYINELHGGDKGVVFATGTPISNSMTEMYTMMSYLGSDTLERIGINYFDAWAADFGETITSLEMAPSGQGYKAKTRFAKFTNLPELLTLYRSFADVQTADMVKLDVPEADKEIITLKPSDTVIDLAEEIADRAEIISHGGVPPEIDNMLKITSDGKKLALDPRCFEPTAKDEKSSKLNACAERIYAVWNDTKDIRGTQIVFCDLSTPKKAFEDYEYGVDFDVYNDLKYKLVQMGILEQEIAYIHEANSDNQKQALFDNVNNGVVRILMGSTEKCGAGTNIQTRLCALHHLDTPYRPSDMQQREGRIVRQGNLNKRVKIFTYVTERTFDSYSYQILENKQRFISQIDRGDLTVREAEDIDETTLTYAEIKAITAANPKIKRKMEVDTEVARLRVLEGQYKKNLYALQDKLRKTYPEDIHRQELFIERTRADMKVVEEGYNPDNFSINVGGMIYTDKKEGARALTEALYASKPETVVAEFAGFKISMNPLVLLTAERSICLAANGQYNIDIGQSASGNMTRIENFLTELPNREKRLVSKLEQLKNDMAVAEEEVKKPFEHAETLANLLREQTELNAELDLNRREEVVIDDDSIDEGEAYMAIPENSGKEIKTRKPLKTSEFMVYQKIQDKEEAVTFIRNGDGYDVIGMQAEELCGKYDKDIFYDVYDGEEYGVFHISDNEFDKVIRSLIEHYGEKVKIVENLSEKTKEDSFIDSEDIVAGMQITVRPDYSVAEEEMTEYGYKWKGMLPLRGKSAKRLFELGVTVYELRDDDTEGKVEKVDDIIKERLYGVEKPDWQAYIESETGKSYLATRFEMCKAASAVVNEDLDSVDEGFTIDFNEINFTEKEALKANTLGYTPDEQYVDKMFEEFTERIYSDNLRYYGWTETDVMKSLSKQITDNDLRARAEHIVEERALREFIQAGLKDYDSYKDIVVGEVSDYDEADEMAMELKTWFEGSPYAKDYTGKAFDEWYEAFTENTVKPILMGDHYIDVDELFEEEIKNMDVDEFREFVGLEPIDYKARVIEAVNDEFREFQDELLKKEPKEIFLSNYKIHVKTELKETIDSDGLEGEYYQALYRDKDYGILQQLYNEYLDSEYSSVNNMQDTMEFIQDYCERHHEGLLKDIRNKEKDENVRFFGTDVGNTAYYYFKDKLGGAYEKPRIQGEADEYVIAAPVCYLSPEYMEEHNITFLKIDRDIDEEVLDTDSDYKAREEMKKAVYRKLPVEAITPNEECKNSIETYIRNNFDGMRLKTDSIRDLLNYYGEERMNYVLANTIRLDETDGRYSIANKEWAKEIVINNEERDRRRFHIASHPAILDGFATAIRKIEKESANKNKETEMAENENKKNWITVNVSHSACIAEKEKHLFMKMPKDSKYNGYTYNIFRSRVKEGRQLVDEESDSHELCYELLLLDGEMVLLKKGDDEVELDSKSFYDIVNGTSDKDYERKEQKEYLAVSISRDDFKGTYEKSSLIALPDDSEYAGYSFYLPNAFIEEDKTREDGYMKISIPEDFTIIARNKEKEEKSLYAQDFVSIMGQEKAKSAAAVKGETKETDNGWKHVVVPPDMFIQEYENTNLMRMPEGKYSGCTFFFPKSLIEDSREQNLKLSFPPDFVIRVRNNKDGVEYELSVDDFINEVKGKKVETYQRPSQTKSDKFAERKAVLDKALPKEMKDKPNWVIVRLRDNPEKGRPDKFLINCHTGKFAESDNPETWSDYETACNYASENGGVTLAYALDGSDGLACIDLDNCINENGEYSELAKEVLEKCGETYAETSISGRGLHVFGSTKGMNVRTFSKDGDMEFYRDTHFIAMTGDGAEYQKFESFDNPGMKTIIERKCDKRTEIGGKGAGVEGLSMMSDRDVVEKACKSKHGDVFKALYDGQNLQNNHSNSDMSLMNRLAFWCNGDKEQMLRIFATSGLYRPNKSADYYECTVVKAIKDTSSRFQQSAKNNYKPKPPVNNSGNGKR